MLHVACCQDGKVMMEIVYSPRSDVSFSQVCHSWPIFDGKHFWLTVLDQFLWYSTKCGVLFFLWSWVIVSYCADYCHQSPIFSITFASKQLENMYKTRSSSDKVMVTCWEQGLHQTTIPPPLFFVNFPSVLLCCFSTILSDITCFCATSYVLSTSGILFIRHYGTNTFRHFSS